jgi:prepilin-type N-terminal cleavage/methylation domain-containing protein
MKFSKSGFTLMELLVYMGIVGIVVVIAGQAFSNSTKFRIRTDNMIRATQEAENVATLIKEDLEHMGAKSSKEAGASATYGDNFSPVYGSIYMDPLAAVATNIDSSSFLISTEDGFDKIVFRRVRYDASGYYEGIEEVSWFVRNGSLWRNCKVLDKVAGLSLTDDPCSDGANSTPTDIEMATGVTEFKLTPSKPSALGDAVQIFPPIGETEFKLVPRRGDLGYIAPTVANANGQDGLGGDVQVISGFYSNYSTETDPPGVVVASERKINELIVMKNESTTETSWKTLCADYGNFTFEPDQVYEISFEIPFPGDKKDKSLMFVPGEDHMSVGLRDYSTGHEPMVDGVKQLEDFMFFPPLDTKGGGKRSMRFTVPNRLENVCLSFTFACFSPLVAQGKLSIKDLKVKKIAGTKYDFSGFDAEAHKTDKQNIKAFFLNLTVARGGETGIVRLVLPTPSNGPRD